MLSSLVAEVYGRPDHSYDDLIAAAGTVAERLRKEPGVVEVDDTVEAPAPKLVFVTDQEKAALNGVSVDEIARTLQLVPGRSRRGHGAARRRAEPAARSSSGCRAPIRSSAHDLAGIRVKGRDGQFRCRWRSSAAGREARVDQTIYHKNLERVVYVFAETAGPHRRPSASST